MYAKILKSRPLSGECDEVLIDLNDEPICIKFEDSEYINYCGIFGGGFGSQSFVYSINNIAFVVSHGQGYIFDINSRTVVHKTKNDQLSMGMLNNHKGYFIASSPIELFVFDGSGLIWSSGRVSSDGIELMGIENNILSGKVYDFRDWVDFYLDLNTFGYECDWQCDML